MNQPPVHIEVHEVDARRWPDFERLFESRGGPKWCWCRMFRRDESGRMAHTRVAMKSAMDDQGGRRRYEHREGMAGHQVLVGESYWSTSPPLMW